MSSSSEALVPRGTDPGRVREIHHPELSSGTWTRRGPAAVRGDAATETFLEGLAGQTRTAAQAQGFATGWAEGLRAARTKAAEEAEALAADTAVRRQAEDHRRATEHQAALAALAAAADSLHRAAAEISEQVAAQACDLAFAVTRELLGRELVLTTDPGTDLVRRVLSVLPSDGAVTVRLPADLVGDPALAGLTAAGVRVVPDPSFGPADAVVETDQSIVDLRLDTALDRLREALS
ncbi:FliH/SctL family protein [Nocardioides ferulae]|uniref:FliH/SctL family protein n=1 Tax=Nocardioides ferulae TaxID=2340821 RepID=UPI000EB1246F|nr:FliH/SctL family protein [Nocardioides ferulae]